MDLSALDARQPALPSIGTVAVRADKISERFVVESALALGGSHESICYLAGSSAVHAPGALLLDRSRADEIRMLLAPDRGLQRFASNYELLHAHFAGTGMRMLRSTKGRPVVMSVHGTDVLGGTWLRSAVLRRCFRSTVLVAPSLFLASAVNERIGAQPYVLPNVVDGARIRRAVARHHRPRSPRFRVAFAGRLVAKKDPLTAIRAVARLQRSVDCELVVVGDGPLMRDCRAEAQGLRRVSFLGALSHDDLLSELSGSDVIVLPSRVLASGDTETFGVVVAEAAALGVPAIVSSAGGLTEVVTNGETGLVCEPGDIIGFASALESMANAPAWRAKLGAAARTASARFSPEAYREGFAKLLAQNGWI